MHVAVAWGLAAAVSVHRSRGACVAATGASVNNLCAHDCSNPHQQRGVCNVCRRNFGAAISCGLLCGKDGAAFSYTRHAGQQFKAVTRVLCINYLTCIYIHICAHTYI